MRRVTTSSLFLAAALLVGACSGGPSGAGESCTTNADCQTGQICISFTCRASSTPKACMNNDDCGIGFFCDTASGQCTDLMDSRDAGAGDAGSSTTSRDAGVRDGGPNTGQCFMDTECGTPPVDICVANQCVKGCGEPDGVTCTGGTVCDTATGHCVNPMMSCQMDGDCNPGPPTQICIGNQCVFGCGIDPMLCQAGEICDTGTGHCVMAPTNCTMDNECSPPMTVCEAPQCVPGCGEPGGIQCSGTTPMCDATTGRCIGASPCMFDADCTGMNEICVNSACVLRCDVMGGLVCNAPQVCNPSTGRCTAGALPLGGTCAFDSQCQSNFCMPLTVAMVSHEICTTGCSSTSDCPTDFTCGNVSGMSLCLPETLTTPPATWDTPSGGACSTTTNTCQSGWCNTGTNQCIETCQRDSDCASFGGQCWTYEQTGTTTEFDHLCFNAGTGGADGAACTTNANCISGVCNRYQNTCGDHCCDDSDCAAAENCGVYDLDATTIVKLCAPRAGTAGTTPFGGTCTAPTDCDSEICAPLDPANAMSPRQCSSTCCTDADCSILPNGGRCRPVGSPVMNTIVGVCIPN